MWMLQVGSLLAVQPTVNLHQLHTDDPHQLHTHETELGHLQTHTQMLVVTHLTPTAGLLHTFVIGEMTSVSVLGTLMTGTAVVNGTVNATETGTEKETDPDRGRGSTIETDLLTASPSRAERQLGTRAKNAIGECRMVDLLMPFLRLTLRPRRGRMRVVL